MQTMSCCDDEIITKSLLLSALSLFWLSLKLLDNKLAFLCLHLGQLLRLYHGKRFIAIKTTHTHTNFKEPGLHRPLSHHTPNHRRLLIQNRKLEIAHSAMMHATDVRRLMPAHFPSRYGVCLSGTSNNSVPDKRASTLHGALHRSFNHCSKTTQKNPIFFLFFFFFNLTVKNVITVLTLI